MCTTIVAGHSVCTCTDKELFLPIFAAGPSHLKRKWFGFDKLISSTTKLQILYKLAAVAPTESILKSPLNWTDLDIHPSQKLNDF